MHHNLAEWVPCIVILHIVCAGEAILVSLLFALACCTHVQIFDIKATCVSHVLVCVPLCYVHIHFAWGLLSLLHSSLNVQDQLGTSYIWYGHLWTASSMGLLFAPTATASTSASCRASTPSSLLGCFVVPLLIVG